MKLHLAAALVFLGAAACSGRSEIRTPIVDLEFGEPTEPVGTRIGEINVPPGESLSLAVGPPPEPAPEPGPTAPDPGEEGTQGATGAPSPPPAAAPEPDREGSPVAAPSAPAEPVPTFAERIAERMVAAMLELLPEAVDPIELIRALRETAAPAQAPEAVEAPAPDPEPEPVAEPAAGTDRLREFMQADKGDWSADQEAAAIAEARESLGPDFDTWPAGRRDGWIATCHYLRCDHLVYANAYALEGDWDEAASDLETRLIGTIGRDRAAEIAAWIRAD